MNDRPSWTSLMLAALFVVCAMLVLLLPIPAKAAAVDEETLAARCQAPGPPAGARVLTRA